MKLPSQAQAHKLLAEEFKQALIVPVRLSGQPKASRIGDSIDVEAEIGPAVTVRALVDTGCTMSAISPGLLGKIRYKRIPQRVKKWMVTMIGPLPLRGVTNVFMEAEGGPELPMRIAVLDLRGLTKGKDFQMLLGLDYLRVAMAKIDIAWSKVEFGCKLMPVRPVPCRVLSAPAQVLPGGAAEPVLRSPYEAGLLPERVSVEMSAEDGHALERLISRFRRAQIAGGMQAVVPVPETPAGPLPAIDQDGGDGGP